MKIISHCLKYPFNAEFLEILESVSIANHFLNHRQLILMHLLSPVICEYYQRIRT